MSIRSFVKGIYDQQIEELTGCREFKAIEIGEATRQEYDAFIGNVIATHLNSPQYLAFLYSVAPPAARERLEHNMLEELGLEEETGDSHPDLLRKLADGAGLTSQLAKFEQQAEERLREVASTRLLYGTLKEAGLSTMCEINAFEYMLSRVSGSMATALEKHRKLDSDALKWFTHHSVVDVQHAEEGFQSIDDFVAYYEFSDEDAKTIAEMSLRENTYIKRYFGDISQGRAAGMLRDDP